MTLQQIRYKLEGLKGQRQQLAADIESGTKQCGQTKQEVEYAEEARAIIQAVAQATQKELEYHISEIVTLALSAVFDNPYKMVLEFVQRRNRTEADILFERDGERVRPIDATGGGAVDVAAVALRVAMWSLRRPRTRNTLILDEPLRFLSRDLMPRAAAMFSEISRKLGLQIIMVSHSPELIDGADRYFEVGMHRRVSRVKEEDGADNKQDQAGKGAQQQHVDGTSPAGRGARAEKGRRDSEPDISKRRQDSRADKTVGRRRRT